MSKAELTAVEMIAALRERARELLEAADAIERGRSLLGTVESKDAPDEKRSRRLEQLAAARAARSAKAKARREAIMNIPLRSVPQAPGPGRPATREQQLVQFLQKHGPTRYKELLETCGLPEGTLSTVLRRSSLIRKTDDGKWEAVHAASANGRAEK